MPQEPVPADPGWDDDPAWSRPDPVLAEDREARAELIRRRPEPGCPLEGPARMPAAWDEFTADELAESRGHAEGMLSLALALAARLPGTKAALRDETLTRYKAEIIAWATQLLDPDEARAAEALVLGRAGRLTPGGLRAAIARAVMEVAPEKARKRREAAARDARVQRWAEDSGNAAQDPRVHHGPQVLVGVAAVDAAPGQVDHDIAVQDCAAGGLLPAPPVHVGIAQRQVRGGICQPCETPHSVCRADAAGVRAARPAGSSAPATTITSPASAAICQPL